MTANYRANGSADPTRYFAHFAYNPKPWQMWNPYSLKWHGILVPVVEWIIKEGYASLDDIPRSLKPNWWQFERCIAPAAPWVWRALKLKRRLFKA